MSANVFDIQAAGYNKRYVYFGQNSVAFSGGVGSFVLQNAIKIGTVQSFCIANFVTAKTSVITSAKLSSDSSGNVTMELNAYNVADGAKYTGTTAVSYVFSVIT